MPRAATKRSEIDSRGQKVGQSGTVHIALEGQAGLERPPLEVIDGPNALAKADELAFMEEPVTIVVHSSGEENEENPIIVGVNGRQVFIPRGQHVIVRRKYVERLARAKRNAYRQGNLDASNDPVRFNSMQMTTALLYNFSVLHDPNPAGPDWLRKVLAESA